MIRLSRDGATYDVPVEGDWVVIAVVAERGEVKLSGTKEEGSEEEEEATATQNRSGGQKKATGQKKVNGKEDATSKTKSFGQKKDEEAEKGKEKWKKRREPRKYINLKLCALPPRSKSTNSGPSGDALLQLLLFASDAIVQEEEEGGEMKRTYRGGSGGAYERWCNLGVGSVVAILNPRVLRPLRVSTPWISLCIIEQSWNSLEHKHLIRSRCLSR